jgi:hypothetical protein
MSPERREAPWLTLKWQVIHGGPWQFMPGRDLDDAWRIAEELKRSSELSEEDRASLMRHWAVRGDGT